MLANRVVFTEGQSSMLTQCVRCLILRENVPITSLWSYTSAHGQHIRNGSSSTTRNVNLKSDHESLLDLCIERFYIAPGHQDSFRLGTTCGYGPLGTELRKNLLDQWWYSVVRSRDKVFGITTLHTSKDGQMKVLDRDALSQALDQKGLDNEQLVQRLRALLKNCSSARTSLLQGALEQCMPSLELVNRRLPFGLAETGMCLQPTDKSCPAEVLQSSLVWFCSPRTSSQWLDYWARQRLQWWTKFALSPSSFSSSDVAEEELGDRASRGVNIVYQFPWGPEPLETLLSRGDAELLQTHQGSRVKLQCRDGRKSAVPHVLSVTCNMDRGVVAYLHNSLQQVEKADNKQTLHRRKVLKLHPVLAPVKVAVDMGKGASVQLRQVCQGLVEEFLQGGISAWSGYLETTPTTMEQLNTKYDEMGVLFTVIISENTLETGLLQVRSRDTTIKETMHVSEVKNFLARYISASVHI